MRRSHGPRHGALSRVDTERIVSALKHRIPALRAVYLYGSHARGDAGPESDIDIAFLAKDPLDAVERHDLAQALSAILNRDVDLLDLCLANSVIRVQAIANGRALYRADSPSLSAFEDFVFSDYARLNEERAGILKDVIERGNVYGR